MDSLSEHLLQLELELMRPEVRRDRERVAALLDPEFVEIGSSGRLWSRDEILDLLGTESDYSQPTVEEFRLRVSTPELALVSYLTRRSASSLPGSVVLRTSLWRCHRMHGDMQWRCVFHQGTPQQADRAGAGL